MNQVNVSTEGSHRLGRKITITACACPRVQMVICGSQFSTLWVGDLDSSHEAWWHAPLPAESFAWSRICERFKTQKSGIQMAEYRSDFYL